VLLPQQHLPCWSTACFASLIALPSKSKNNTKEVIKADPIKPALALMLAASFQWLYSNCLDVTMVVVSVQRAIGSEERSMAFTASTRLYYIYWLVIYTRSAIVGFSV